MNHLSNLILLVSVLTVLLSCDSEQEYEETLNNIQLNSTEMDSSFLKQKVAWGLIADSMFGDYSFGLAIDQRLELYTELIILERRARAFADSVIPDWQTNAIENWDLFISKKNQYVNDLIINYGITHSQLDSIRYEAYLRFWPLPEPGKANY